MLQSFACKTLYGLLQSNQLYQGSSTRAVIKCAGNRPTQRNSTRLNSTSCVPAVPRLLQAKLLCHIRPPTINSSCCRLQHPLINWFCSINQALRLIISHPHFAQQPVLEAFHQKLLCTYHTHRLPTSNDPVARQTCFRRTPTYVFSISLT